MFSTRSPVPVAEPTPTFELLSAGSAAFARILGRIEQARRSIQIRCFEWRDDETGRQVAAGLLAAAERGVQVRILKDRMGGFYEHLADTKQSLFHKDIDFGTRWRMWGLMMFYGRWGSLRQVPSPLAESLVAHPNVRVVRERRFDHAKVFVFDEEVVILGGMGIGDGFRHLNVDFMVEIAGADAAERLADRYAGQSRFDPTRPFDYLLHSFGGQTRTGESLARHRLGLIAAARKRLTIAMAYLGDPASTDALCAAVERGVSVRLLTSAHADVGHDLNLFTCAQILRRTGSPRNLHIVLHPTMVHAKAIIGDGEWVDLGSTNFTALSHGCYEELDLFCRDRAFARRVEAAIGREAALGILARLPLDYRFWRLGWELAITTMQTWRPPPIPHAAR